MKNNGSLTGLIALHVSAFCLGMSVINTFIINPKMVKIVEQLQKQVESLQLQVGAASDALSFIEASENGNGITFVVPPKTEAETKPHDNSLDS